MPRKTVEDWTTKEHGGWLALPVDAGAMQSIEVPLLIGTEALVVKGQVYLGDGVTQIRGFERPKFHKIETLTGASVVFGEPLPIALIFLYKIVSIEDV